MFFFPNGFLFPQNFSRLEPVPINGFCKYKSFTAAQGYLSIFPFNYNLDSYTDILLYSSFEKKINILTGNENGEFSKQDSIKVPYRFSSIKSIYRKGKETGEYAFSSRRDRTAGIFHISESGKFSIESILEFDSYPENISVADVNGDGSKEILVSGSAFEGLSLLFRKNKKLSERKIEDRKIYTDAVFVDLNNDNIPDIAGFDLITNSLNLFYNYGDGEFRKVRSIPVDGRVNLLESFDMNSDSYEDLILCFDNYIKIYFNDFRSSFEKSFTINSTCHPDKIVTGDFNKDGKIDIAYINYEQEILSVIFAGSDSMFYPEIVYLKEKGLKDLVPFYSKFVGGIAGISSSGELFTITRLTSFSEDVQAVLGSEPSSITYFDYEDNGVIDFCFLNNYSLTAVLRNSAGIPYYYYSIPLFQTHSDVKTFSISPVVKSFYCYTSGQKLIEALVVNFSTGLVEKKSFYSHGFINDLKIIKDNDDKINILTSYMVNEKAGIDLFKYSSNSYLNENNEIDVKNIISNIPLGKGKSIFFWEKDREEAKFLTIDFEKAQDKLREKISLSLRDRSGDYNIIVLPADLFNMDKTASISFFSSKKDTFIVISAGNSFSKIRNDEIDSLNIIDKKQLFFGEIRFNGLKKLSLYSPLENSFSKLEFINEGKKFVTTKLAGAQDLSSFFIKNMNSKNYHIVYTKNNSSIISFKKIVQ